MKDKAYKKIYFCFIIFMMVTVSIFAQLPSKDETYDIMDKIFERRNFSGDITCTLSLIIEKPNQPKEAAQYKLFRRDNKDQTCLIQLAPESDKGNGYLQEKDNLWFYDPIAHQFTHSSIKRNLGNSDTKISDVKSNSTFRSSWEIINVEEAMLIKYPVYVVTAKSLTSDASYSQQKYFVRKDVHLLLKIESYGASGKHMRTTLIPKYKKIQDIPFPIQQVYINELVKGEKTTQIFQDFDTTSIPDIVFTKAYLEKIN